jgi:hypothetical protein
MEWGWTVYQVNEPHPKGNTTFTIGLWYAYSHPDILFLGEMPKPNMAGALQAIAIKVAMGLQVQPDMTYGELWKEEDEEDDDGPPRNTEFDHCKFTVLKPEDYPHYVFHAQWFYLNFADSWDFPVLVCHFTKQKNAV